MDTTELVRQWKNPSARAGQSADHPAGEIRLRTAGRLARRSVLLAGQESSAGCDTGPGWETMTVV